MILSRGYILSHLPFSDFERVMIGSLLTVIGGTIRDGDGFSEVFQREYQPNTSEGLSLKKQHICQKAFARHLDYARGCHAVCVRGDTAPLSPLHYIL